MTDKDKNKSSYLTINFKSVVSPIMKTILAKADSGALSNCLKNEDKDIVINMKPATNQVVNIPNNKVITYSFKAQIPYCSVISQKARDAHVFKYLYSASLVSLGK